METHLNDHDKIQDVFNRVIYLSPPGQPKRELGQAYDSLGNNVTERLNTSLRELFNQSELRNKVIEECIAVICSTAPEYGPIEISVRKVRELLNSLKTK